MELNEISYKVRDELGPGLLESVYHASLQYELTRMGLDVEGEVGLPVWYKNIKLEVGFRIDLLVDQSIIIEIKSIEKLHDLHKKQLLTYLELSKVKVGILVNFNVVKLEDKISLIRIIN